jgi:hypothetical protein
MVRSSRINRKVRGTRRRNVRGNSRVSTRSGASAGAGAGLGLIGSLVGAAALSQGSELDNHHNQNQGNEQSSTTMMMAGGKRGRLDRKGMRNDDHDVGLRNCAEYILCFLELLNTIKIYHWSTLSYPTHKATDELHEKLSGLVDSFIEIYIGHLARRGSGNGLPIFKKGIESIPFCGCKSLDEFCKTLDGNISFMEGLTERLNGYTDLVNIRDEMVGTIAQALYLLRLA